jgi:methionine-gamma-lyase
MEIKMSSNKNLQFDSKCVHAGIGEYEFGSVVPPIYQTSTFKFESAAHGAKLFKGEEEGFIYTRLKNPTIEAMENAVAELEEGHKALGCASGMAAISTVFAGLLKQGDHVICSYSVYGPTLILLKNFFTKFGVESDFVDTANIELVEASLKPNTKMIYVESPANPVITITDIAAVAKLAHSKNAYLVVDNTFMSPALQKPLNLGADISLHSMTKFLNGHADVVAGIIIVKNEEMYSLLKKTLNMFGGVIDPFNSFLVHRGLKTLSIRIEKHCENALLVAQYLENHPKVKWVKYPGLKSHPQYELGLRQHSGAGGMISFEVAGGIKGGEITMNSVKLCQLAVSLGGVESLIQHPASMTHSGMSKEDREAAGISDGLVRLSVGIENAKDIIDDLEQALAKVEVPIESKVN